MREGKMSISPNPLRPVYMGQSSDVPLVSLQPFKPQKIKGVKVESSAPMRQAPTAAILPVAAAAGGAGGPVVAPASGAFKEVKSIETNTLTEWLKMKTYVWLEIHVDTTALCLDTDQKVVFFFMNAVKRLESLDRTGGRRPRMVVQDYNLFQFPVTNLMITEQKLLAGVRLIFGSDAYNLKIGARLLDPTSTRLALVNISPTGDVTPISGDGEKWVLC